MTVKWIVPKDVSKARGFSHAAKVGNTIYVAGQVARDEQENIVGKGDIVAQTERAYENLKRVLAAAGAGMTDIVKLNIFCRDLDGFKNTGEVRRKYFGNHYPVTTAIEVSRMMNPDCLIEIEAIAVKE